MDEDADEDVVGILSIPPQRGRASSEPPARDGVTCRMHRPGGAPRGPAPCPALPCPTRGGAGLSEAVQAVPRPSSVNGHLLSGSEQRVRRPRRTMPTRAIAIWSWEDWVPRKRPSVRNLGQFSSCTLLAQSLDSPARGNSWPLIGRLAQKPRPDWLRGSARYR